MAHIQNAPPYYSLLSEKLCDILDEVGVSEEDRRETQESNKAFEICISLSIRSMNWFH